MIAAAIALCMIGQAPAEPHAPPAAPSPPMARPVMLQMANRVLPRLVPSRVDFDALLSATKAKDDAAISGLKSEGRLLEIPTGTSAEARETGVGGRRVVVVTGPKKGNVGWVEDRFIRDISAPPTLAVSDEIQIQRQNALQKKRARSAANSAAAANAPPPLIYIPPSMPSRAFVSGSSAPRSFTAIYLGVGHFCGATTLDGTPCQRWIVNTVHCYQHGN